MVKTKAGRGTSWCPSSVDLLLDITVAVLPLGKNQWEKVAQRFGTDATAQSLPHRDAEALKRKFLLLKNVQKPTGHPDVLHAKRLQREIESSVAVLSMDATISMDDEPDDSDDCSGASESDAKASSDMMSFLMVMRERDAKREEMRHERQEKTDRLREERVEKADRDREAREARCDELQFLLGNIFGKNESS
ncbi:hypothetical protein B5M09_008235 [Aphanomyces astaci]|uniref:DUF6818 domain-containing protein n=1 Tax=Aphanomyces astaci TaxID=112090 RepID=A0A425CW27_APHAT|nr:hypothetical protein B5M09_008235 [Aphanomyces astaci]